MSADSFSRADRCILAALVALFLAIGTWFIFSNSQTFDESAHWNAGVNQLLRHDYGPDFEHPPLSKMWSALPYSIGRSLGLVRGGLTIASLRMGRMQNLVWGALLVCGVALWSYRLWGRRGALLSATLASLDPNMIANAGLVTPDMALTLFVFLTMYAFWEYLRKPGLRSLVLTGVMLGCAFASKFSAFIVPVALSLLGAESLWARTGLPLPTEGNEKKSWPLRIFDTGLVLVLLCSIGTLVLCAFYGIKGLPWLPRGVSFQLNHAETGHDAFFLGSNRSSGWLLYYQFAFMVKTPLGTLFFIALSLLTAEYGRRLTRRDAAFLLLPPALFFLLMTWGRIDIGLRYILPVYPFLFVLCGRVCTIKLRWFSRMIGATLALTALGSLLVTPFSLSYFNLLAGGPDAGYRYLGDSNLDWGEGYIALREYMRRENVPIIYLSYFSSVSPENYGIEYQFVPSSFNGISSVGLVPPDGRQLLVVSVSNIQGIYMGDKSEFAWLASRTPVEKIAHVLYVYDITCDRDAHRQLAKMYEQNGYPELKAHEDKKAALPLPASCKPRA
jgi:hypothetical protein